MEYMNNGDIKGYIAAHQNMGKPIPEEELWDLFYQCMSGLICIHKNQLIHRDIKPANLFLTDDKTIKIGDFGVSATRNKNTPDNNSNGKAEKQTMMIGTPLYMSPEMFNHEKYGSKVDIYALGCSFYEMCYFTPPRIPIPKMNLNFEITTDLQEIPVKNNKDFYSKEMNDLIYLMIEKDHTKRGRDDDIFEIIRKNYYLKCKRNINSSISAIYRCLLSYNDFVLYLNRHSKDIEGVNKPITYTFSLAKNELYANNGINWAHQIKKYRTILTYYNSSFTDPGEIEIEDLIEYILKTIHIECNKTGSKFSRIFSQEDDPDILQRNNILMKYLGNFQSNFKSIISGLFFGTLETMSSCMNCNTNKSFFENFIYLIIDVKEAIKYINPVHQNFISVCFQNQINSKFYRTRFCLNCKTKTNHSENKNYYILPKNLIIILRNEEYQNISFLLNLDLSFLSKENYNAKYNLKGVIKKSNNQKKKTFTCLYEDPQQKLWFISDGNQNRLIDNIYNDNSGIVVTLIYGQ
jgi:serine/threonine protein kinase